MMIETQEQAVEALVANQVANGYIPTQPSWGDTLETPTGWAFFNTNGYLGTVTLDGDVIFEAEFGEAPLDAEEEEA